MADEREEGRALYPCRVPLEPVVECSGAEAPAMRDLVPVLGVYRGEGEVAGVPSGYAC